ncbi:hypothetical protein N7445_006053 [Penicillium cf. griseofulvum]|nr:hypothetical protein N7445_006053 [Penicillium cf. griseofulvum]
MVKTTYALTLFAAVSLAAPVPQLTGRAEKQASVEHKNLIEGIPIIGPILGGKQDVKRDNAQPQHHNIIDDLPIIGRLLGNANQNQRRDIAQDGISGLPLLGGLFGSHKHTGGANGINKRGSGGQNYGQNSGQNGGQNYGQNAGQNSGQNVGQNGGSGWKRSLESSLSSIPIIGELLKNKPSHKHIETPPKQLNTRQAGRPKGIFGLLESLTSGKPVSKSHKRAAEFDQLESMDDLLEGAVATGMDAASAADSFISMRRDESVAPTASQAQKGNQKGSQNQEAKESKASSGLLGTLMGKEGPLGAIMGNAHHGVGLLPMRRDANELEARQAPPIQGASLTSVLLEGGALGKVTKLLSGGAETKHDTNSPLKIGDSSTAGPPNPASGAGPHSGPGLAAQKQGSKAASE